VILSAGARLHSYAAIAVFAFLRGTHLFEPFLRLQLHRQLRLWGIAATPLIVTLAALIGSFAVSQVTALVGPNNEVAERLFFNFLVFEVSPVLCAMVLVARSSAAIAAELVMMHARGEFTALRRMNVVASDFLLLPRLWGLSLALATVTLLFQGVLLASAAISIAFTQHLSPLETFGRLLEVANPWLVPVCILKSLLMGILISAIACHHGTEAQVSVHAASDASVYAVGGGILAIFVVEAVFVLVAHWLP
jgi:phospholipid/cholesterol/gamma-HCH transport system permease protein